MGIIRFSLISVRSFKQKSIIAIILASSIILMFGGLFFNSSQPVVYNHYEYMDINASQIGNTNNFTVKGFILDRNLQPESNSSFNFSLSTFQTFFSGNNLTACEQLILKDLQSQKRVTNSDGLFSLEINGPGNYSQYSDFQQVMSYLQYDFVFSIKNLSGSQQDSILEFNPGQSFLILPYYNLGNYGTAAVVYIPGNSSDTFNLSYETYSNLTTNTSTILSLGTFHYGIPQRVGNYNQILSMNEAYSVAIYFNNVLDTNLNFPPSTSGVSFTSNLGFPIYFFSAISVIFITMAISTNIFDKPMNEFYLSIPEKRRNVIIVSVILGTVATIISTAIAFLLGDIIWFATSSNLLNPSSIANMMIFNLFLFAVISPIYFFFGTHTRYGSGIKMGISLMLVIGVPIISSLIETTLFVNILSSSLGINLGSQVNQGSMLYLPYLQEIRVFNLLTGLIPFTAPMELFDYIARSPFIGVEMLNHLSLFYLSPLIFFTPLITWFVPLIYLSIRKYDRI